MKKDFEAFLIREGYKTHTPSGHPSTVYDYIKRIDMICEWEHTNWNGLAEKVDLILPIYEEDGNKAHLGRKSHNAVRCALRCFHRFCQCRNPIK